MRPVPHVHHPATSSLLALSLALVACGGGGGPDAAGPPAHPLAVAPAPPSGDGQAADPGEPLPDPLRVVVRRGADPAAGVAVGWSVASGGGSVTPASTTTGADGIASTRWTLGPAAGAQGARATVAGATGSPVSFSATATGGAAQNLVLVENNAFSPATITVSAGATVEWLWPVGSLLHNIVPVAPATIPSEPAFRNGPSSYSTAFATPGTYRYYCRNHGTPTSGMRGTVVVR